MRPQTDRIFTPNYVYLCLTVLCFFISFVLFFPTLPIYIREHGGSGTLIGALVGGASIVSLISRPFTGGLVDRFGRRRFMIAGTILLAVSAIGYDFVYAVPVFWIVRLIAGAGIALYATASMAYAADIAPPTRRGQAMSYYGMFSTVGIALGPPLGMWLITTPGLRGPERFLERWLPGTGSDVSHEYNFAVLFVAAALVAAAGLLALRGMQEVVTPVKRARQSASQALHGMFEKTAALPATIQMLMLTNQVTLNIFIPLYALEVLGMKNAGFYYTCYALAVIAVRLVSGRALDRYPRPSIMVPALLLMMAGTLMLALVQMSWTVFAAGVVVGAGNGLGQPALQAFMVDRTPRDRLGTASSTFNLGQDFALGAGGFVMGVLLQATGFRTMFVVAGLSSALGGVVLAVATLRARTARKAPAAAPLPPAP